MTKSKWELASDIYTDYTGTITEATFRFNEFGGQASFLVDEIDGRDQPTFENYDLPVGWESNDGGETIERVDGSDKGITKASKWGRFLRAAGSLPGAREALGEDAPTDMRYWIGTRWSFEAVEGKPYKFTNKDGEKVEGVSKDKNYPTEFLGKDATNSPATAGTNGNGKVDSLSVLTDLHNPVLEQAIGEFATSLDKNAWFNQSYQAIVAAGVQPGTIPDLITAMGENELYVKLGGKG